MEITPLLVTFILIAIAELGDKTQLTVIALSAMYEKGKVFSGLILAFILVTGIGVLLGDTLYRFVDPELIKVIAGVLFLVFGIWILRSGNTCESNDKIIACNPFLSTFSMIFFAEMGDKTQLSAITLSAKFHSPLMVFTGAVCALVIISLIGIFIGRNLMHRIPLDMIKSGAGVLFILSGIFFLAGF